MLKLRNLGRFVLHVATDPMDAKPARKLFHAWTACLVLGVAILCMSILFGSVFGIAVGILNVSANVFMVKTSASRYADAKHRVEVAEEKAAWERSMFEEWSRA